MIPVTASISGASYSYFWTYDTEGRVETATAAAPVGTPIGVAEFQSGRRTRTIADGVFARALLATGDRLLIGTIDEGVVEVKLDNARGFRLPLTSEYSPAEVRRFLAVQGIPFALGPDGLSEQNVRTGLWTRRIAAADASWTVVISEIASLSISFVFGPLL